MTPKEINIFEQVNEHLGIGGTMLQYDSEFEDGERKNKKRVLNSVMSI